MTENEIATIIVDNAFRIHFDLGPASSRASTKQSWRLSLLNWLTYLRFADKRLGLLINFNVALIKDGIVRLVNKLRE